MNKTPEEALKVLLHENFEHSLNSLIVIGYLSQLFIIEQEYGYPRKSKYNPSTLFYQGWVRHFIDNIKEDLVISAKGRKVSGTKDIFQLRETSAP